jgi:SpoVK/Ycf46/Vps4 family AAA+-type ATPase
MTASPKSSNRNVDDYFALLETTAYVVISCAYILIGDKVAQTLINYKRMKSFQETRRQMLAEQGGAKKGPTDLVSDRLATLLKKRMGRTPSTSSTPSDLALTKQEKELAEGVVDPDLIESSLADIRGLDEIKREIWELVVLPLRKPDLFFGSSSLSSITTSKKNR